MRTNSRKPEATCIWLILIGLCFAFSLGPLGWMAIRALGAASLSDVLRDSNLWKILGRTVALSLSVAVLTAFLGGVTGYLLGSSRWRGKSLARAVLILPLAIPPYFYAIGWTRVFRPRGDVASFIASIFDVSPAFVSEAVYSFPAAAIILSLAYFPITMLFCEKSLALSSPSLSEAARVSGADAWQTFLAARWPFMRPALASSAMIVFLLAAAELGVPTLLKVRVFNFEVLTQMGAFNNVTTATLLSISLLGVAFLALAAERRLNKGNFFQLDVEDIAHPFQASPLRAKVNIRIFIFLALLVLGIPFGALLSEGLNPDALGKMLRLAWRPAVNTLYYAFLASLIVTVGSITLAWILRRSHSKTIALTDGILIVGFAVPGTILALALLAVYDRPGVSRFITPAALVITALVVRYAVVGYRILGASIERIPRELFEASELDGAGPWATIRLVLIPLTRVALFATLAITFVLSLGEIGATILLYPPGGETLTIALYSIEANSPRAYVSALTLLQIPLILLPLGILAWTLKSLRAP